MTDFIPAAGTDGTPPLVRRRGLLAILAGAAAFGGAGLAWWQQQRQSRADETAKVLWPLRFDTPHGGELAMAGMRGRPLLLNFWATWCPPCVEELPMLSAFYTQHSGHGWQVLGLAVDQREPVQRFLARAPVAFPVALAGASGLELGRALGNAGGALPFTVVLDSNGRVAHRKMGQVSADELHAWAVRS